MSTPAPTAHQAWTQRSPAIIVAIVAIWFGLWYLTPGLLVNGVGSFLTNDEANAVLIETVLALVFAVVLVLLHRKFNRKLFARDWTVWLYAIPLIAGIALPFHYGLEFHVALYMFWMTVSVFWQDYLTFGLLQKYLSKELPSWAVLVSSALIFWAGHALFLPDKFAPVHVLPSLAILVLGFILASLRLWRGTLHLILALHLGFYFIFA